MTEVDNLKKPLPKEFEKISQLVNLMDSKFSIPGTKYRFGIDPLLNLIPGAGQAIDLFISGYIALALFRNGTSGKLTGKMLWNILLDSLVGSIPILGTFFDFAFKANRRNLKLAHEYYETGKHQGSGVIYFAPFILAVFALFAIIIIVAIFSIKFIIANF